MHPFSVLVEKVITTDVLKDLHDRQKVDDALVLRKWQVKLGFFFLKRIGKLGISVLKNILQIAIWGWIGNLKLTKLVTLVLFLST